MSTRGPVHLLLLDTTSARSERSVNATFGCALNWRHASFVGIILVAAERDMVGLGATSGTVLGDAGKARQSPVQSAECVEDSLMALQNARPNESSPQAKQLSGSPEHVA